MHYTVTWFESLLGARMVFAGNLILFLKEPAEDIELGSNGWDSYRFQLHEMLESPVLAIERDQPYYRHFEKRKRT